MALTVFESSTPIPANTDTQVIVSSGARKAMKIQLQADGFLWFSFNQAASRDDGFRVRGWEIVDLGLLVGTRTSNGADFYDGFILARWDPAGLDPPASANVRVIEAT